ncbi:hypothetical protein OE88DRAFT_1646345 [Heliocybe sulcata]|uniref:Uncharacterized protein n=1 Tax=Heliocybe sulcata TaxID=5364 RepID=A0A5C3MVB7_9AGAM|nr:hypothetical protein OE88DRAFT_1646345 [Heliocybe sulcata]
MVVTICDLKIAISAFDDAVLSQLSCSSYSSSMALRMSRPAPRRRADGSLTFRLFEVWNFPSTSTGRLYAALRGGSHRSERSTMYAPSLLKLGPRGYGHRSRLERGGGVVYDGPRPKIPARMAEMVLVRSSGLCLTKSYFGPDSSGTVVRHRSLDFHLGCERVINVFPRGLRFWGAVKEGQAVGADMPFLTGGRSGTTVRLRTENRRASIGPSPASVKGGKCGVIRVHLFWRAGEMKCDAGEGGRKVDFASFRSDLDCWYYFGRRATFDSGDPTRYSENVHTGKEPWTNRAEAEMNKRKCQKLAGWPQLQALPPPHGSRVAGRMASGRMDSLGNQRVDIATVLFSFSAIFVRTKMRDLIPIREAASDPTNSTLDLRAAGVHQINADWGRPGRSDPNATGAWTVGHFGRVELNNSARRSRHPELPSLFVLVQTTIRLADRICHAFGTRAGRVGGSMLCRWGVVETTNDGTCLALCSLRTDVGGASSSPGVKAHVAARPVRQSAL